MSLTTTIQAHIAYDLIDENKPDVVVIEFLSHEIAGHIHARELGEQLDLLIRPDLPRIFVMDFRNMRFLGSTAFGEIVLFAHKVARLYVCNMSENLRFGASLIGLDECTLFASSRWAAVNSAIRLARRGEDDTVDYPPSWVESNTISFHSSHSA